MSKYDNPDSESFYIDNVSVTKEEFERRLRTEFEEKKAKK